jgi:tetratricopeptide (TPR) repeat protein
MRFLTFTASAFLFICSLSLQAQTKREMEELYKDANSYFYFEDYEEAVALYLQVYNSFPNNSNLCYRIGVCYLNIPGYKTQAIQYLEKASQNTKRHYSEESIIENKAPWDAVFYLGNAYFIANQLDKARSEYLKFKELIKNEKSWNLTYYDHQVSTLKNSEILQKYPVNFLRSNLGDQINNRFMNFNPIISGDENTIAFTTKQKFYQAIYVTRKVNDKWSTPINITLDLQVDGNCSTLSLSNDGTELYLFKDDSHDGNIYVTHFLDDRWSPMKKLNENINTKYYETYACISNDGKKLYFTSNRKGGYGDQDIYVSEREGGDIWGPAKNLGPTINSFMNEASPSITTDGNTLFFSSEGHNNLGGYDIFYSQIKSDGSWSDPINLGYPINTTDDDIFFTPVGDGSKGLLALFDKEGFGEQDIYQLDVFTPRYQRSIVTSNDLLKPNIDNRIKSIVIDTINKSSVALIDFAKSDLPSYIDPKKSYKLFFNGKEYDLRDQAEKTKTIAAQLQQTVKEEKISIATTTSGLITDSNVTEVKDFSTVQQRVYQLKGTSDSTRSIKTQTNNIIGKDSKMNANAFPEKGTLAETNYLPEILTLLSTNHSQDRMIYALQQDWHFPATLLKLRISQLTMAVDSAGSTEELLGTFTKFIDLLCSSEFVTLKNQTRSISGENNNQAFIYLFNHLLDKSSPELKEFLERIHQKYPTVNSFAKLWRLMKNENPELFKKLMPEIVRLLAEISIENYIGLPEDQKFKLYEKLTTNGGESKSSWWYFLIIFGYGLIGAAGYVYLKRRYEE